MKLVLHLQAANTENLTKIKKIVWYFLNWTDWCLQATNEVVTRVPKATQGEMQAAVDSCKKAFQSWSETTVLTRQAHMFKLQNLIREHLVKTRLHWTQRTSLAIWLWLNCLHFLIKQPQNTPKMDCDPRYDANVDTNAPNQSLILSVNRP